MANKKVLGKFKDEAGGKVIHKFAALRAKMYALDIEGSELKKIKGITRGSVKRFIQFQDYKDCLLNKIIKRAPMNLIHSKLHQVVSVEMNKVALSPHDDKRVIKTDGIATYAYGHHALTNS